MMKAVWRSCTGSQEADFTKNDKPIPSIQLESSDDEARTRDDLLDELSQLRVGITYLKKLDALVQVRELAAQRKKRKS